MKSQSNKTRLLFQFLALQSAIITAFSVCDFLDKQTSEQHSRDSSKIDKPVLYYESPEDSSEVNIVSEYIPSAKSYSVADCDTVVIPRVDSDVELDDSGVYEIANYVEPCMESEEIYESLEIPYGDCSSYMFMDYRAITDWTSEQWGLQQYAYDGDYGIREVDGCYCVAVSSIYGNIGDKIKVTTDRGNSYWCIIADIKGYDSVDGWYHVNSQGTINLIEFIVDTDYIPNECWQFGDMGVIDTIGGNVIKIER